MANDKPNINLTLTALEAEASAPEPFVFSGTGGKRITFPDLYDMPAEDAIEFFDDLEKRGQNDFDVLEKWLPKDAFAAYKAEKLSLRQHARLVQMVLSYYEQTVGNTGKGNASAN